MITEQLLIDEIHQLPESLKEDVWQYILQLKSGYLKQITPVKKRNFKIRQFHLGTDINPDRSELYTEQNKNVCD